MSKNYPLEFNAINEKLKSMEKTYLELNNLASKLKCG
jgi:hypothetical protein